MNDLKKVSLFVTPESCHNKQSTDNYCPAHKKTHHKENEQEKNNCCDNNVDYLKALDSNIDFVSFNNYSFEQKLIAIISILLFEVNFLDIDYKYSSFFEYVSPPLIQDFPVFYQSFLI